MGSLAADDRSFLEAALKHAHETYRERNALSMKSHHEVSSFRWLKWLASVLTHQGM